MSASVEHPKNHNRPMTFKAKAFDNYDILFTYSWESRYEGITTDFTAWQEIRKADYLHAMKLYEYLRNYVNGEGVKNY